MIFPGMDPYLEDPQLWPGVHSALIVYLRDQLQPLLRPRYIAAIQERVLVEGPARDIIPDVWLRRSRRVDEAQAAVAVAEPDEPIVVQVPELTIHDTFIEILDRHSLQSIVTVIEVVSPWNKYPGPGRESYIRKQTEVRQSSTHLVEIDLLRTGPQVLAVPEWVARGQRPYDYLCSVNRARGPRDLFDLYPRSLRERLPSLGIPLAGDDPDVRADLQSALNQVYEAGSYRDRIDYFQPSRPPLDPHDESWARELITRAFGADGQAEEG